MSIVLTNLTQNVSILSLVHSELALLFLLPAEQLRRDRAAGPAERVNHEQRLVHQDHVLLRAKVSHAQHGKNPHHLHGDHLIRPAAVDHHILLHADDNQDCQAVQQRGPHGQLPILRE